MERLTEQHYKKSDGHYMKCSEYCEKEDLRCDECKEFDELVDRLGVIEDILGDNYDLDHLRELMEADRDGRCVVSPFKPGDQVWVVERDEIGVADCVSGYVFIAFSGGCALVHPYIGGCGELNGILHNCLECTREDGGCDVEVFLIDDCHKSREAAEQALEVENMG